MFKVVLLLFVTLVVACDFAKAQLANHEIEIDTVWIEDDFVTGSVVYCGILKDTIQTVIEIDSEFFMMVINESISIKYADAHYNDSIIKNLVFENNEFIRTDNQYPCNSLYVNKTYDSIVIHRNCVSDEVTNISIASIKQETNKYFPIKNISDFFYRQTNIIDRLCTTRYYFFLVGTYNSKTRSIEFNQPSPSWILTIEDNSILLFQFCDSFVVGEKRYKVDLDEMY